LWQNGSTQPTFTVTVAGQYWVEVNTPTCYGGDTIEVTFSPRPVIALGSDTALCVGDTTVLNAFNTGATYAWNDGSTLPVKTVFSTGDYIVSVNLDRCVVADSVILTFNNPPPAIDFPPDSTICNGDLLLLNAGCNGCAYNWQNGTHDSTYTANSAGSYFVAVSNACGQSAYHITVNSVNCNCRMFIPNVFTPNGDGKNDLFMPEYDCGLVYYYMKIFDRWGEKVFESFSPAAGWDGSFKNKHCPEGVYVYSLEYIANDGVHTTNAVHKKGSVTLLR
jgi:gliding motility-associated-like protein